jgi:hypothetical protein
VAQARSGIRSRVEPNTKFTQKAEIRTKPGRDDQFIGCDASAAAPGGAELKAVCTENPIRVYRMMESARLAQWLR